MRVGSLFAGIGGFDEGLRRAGMESVWQVEKESFCLKILTARFPSARKVHDILTCRGLISSVPESHAKTFPLQGNGQDSPGRVQDSFTSLRDSCKSFDPLGSCLRMFPDFSVLTTEETLQKSSAFSWSNAGMGFAGVSLTANFSESPNVADVCSLSDVLESPVPQRFFLSARAAKGILRRAQKRGRILPTRLQKALEELAAKDATTEPISLSGRSEDRPGAADSSLTQSKPQTGISSQSLLTPSLEETSDPLSVTRHIAPDNREQPLLSPLQSLPATQSRLIPATPTEDRQTSYWDDSQITDTLDCSMLAKGRMMPEKRRFPCVLTPEESAKVATQPTPSPRTCGTDPKAQPTMSVRRLTPTECETLQGFPKGWTVPDTVLLETPSPYRSSNGSEEEL